MAPAPTRIYTLSLHDTLPILDNINVVSIGQPAGIAVVHFFVENHLLVAQGAFVALQEVVQEFGHHPEVNDSNARDRKSTRLNSSHEWSSYAVLCLKKKNAHTRTPSVFHSWHQRPPGSTLFPYTTLFRSWIT